MKQYINVISNTVKKMESKLQSTIGQGKTTYDLHLIHKDEHELEDKDMYTKFITLILELALNPFIALYLFVIHIPYIFIIYKRHKEVGLYTLLISIILYIICLLFKYINVLPYIFNLINLIFMRYAIMFSILFVTGEQVLTRLIQHIETKPDKNDNKMS